MVSVWQGRCGGVLTVSHTMGGVIAMSTMSDPEPAAPGEPCGCPRAVLCPLSRVRAGMTVRIKRLCATPEVARRLRELGLGEEQIVRLVTCQANLICQVCHTRLALSAQLAQAILVEPLVGARATG